MALFGILWMIIFNYVPMYGIIIAFKEFNIVKPISAAPWVGWSHFQEFFQDESFVNVMRNTLGISLIKLAIGFPLPIIFALFLNEVRSVLFKRSVQTISYLPHFLSWVILGGILTTWLSDVGIVNHVLLALNVIKEPISYLAELIISGALLLPRIFGRSSAGPPLFIWPRFRAYRPKCMRPLRLTGRAAFKKCGTLHCRASKQRFRFCSFWQSVAS